MQYDALSHATFTYIASFLKGLNKYMMKNFERFGVRAEIVSLCEIPVPKHHFEASPLSEDMLIEMIRYAMKYELEEYCGSTLTILILGACMGLRKGEILGARWSDIIPGTKNEKNTMRLAVLRQRQNVLGEEFERVPKDGYDDGKTMGERKQRYTSCSDKCLRLLQLVKKEQEKYKTVTDDDYIFQEIKYMKRGQIPPARVISNRFNDFQKRFHQYFLDERKVEVEHIRLHDLRHTFAQMLRDHGIELYKISYCMGHTMSGNITQKVYLHDDGIIGRREVNECIDSILSYTASNVLIL